MGQFSELDTLDRDAQILVAVRARVAERLAQHRENLDLWRSGYLAPTEPDPEERAAVVRELAACVAELEALAQRLDVDLETAMPNETKPKAEPERTHCHACGVIDVARPVTIDGLDVLICTRCGTLRAARPRGD